MALNLVKTVVDFLKQNAELRFTSRDIAQWIFENYPEECRVKKDKSKATAFPIDSDNALIQQIAAEIASRRPGIQKKFEQIKTTDGRPRKYYYTNLSDEAEISATGISASLVEEGSVTYEHKYAEHDLYRRLSKFLWSELKIFSKRIDEKRAKNKHGAGANKWLFPDLVGFEDLTMDWEDEIKNLVTQTSDQKTKLWSFEVKKFINRSNVREGYFQAVSNSSWANFGYLVAAEIQGAEKELRILAGLHGIGVIKLDVENPADSEILIPCRERPGVDWNAANRLADENADFSEYIKLIRHFYQTGDHREKDWDSWEGI